MAKGFRLRIGRSLRLGVLIVGGARLIAATQEPTQDLKGPASVPETQATQYTFTRIADTERDDPGLGGVSCVGLNNPGTVIVNFAPVGASFMQLWRGDGHTFTPVSANAAPCGSINDLDETAYMTWATGIRTLVRNTNGVETPLASSVTPPYLFSSGSLNNGGSVVFESRGVPGSGTGAGIYIAPADTPVYNASIDPPLAFYATGGMNDSHTVAFVAIGSGGVGIYRGSATPLIETGDTVSVGAISIANRVPAINNSGTVAFVGSTSGTATVYTTSDGYWVTPVGTRPLDRIAMNASGTVAFRKASGIGSGIFVGRPGSMDEEVIGFGDAIDGSTLVEAFIWEEAINDHGQIAFKAHLADGRQGVYRADPVEVNADADGDGVLDDADNCPAAANAAQEDSDGDGQGDACDPDDDNDGFADEVDSCQFEPGTAQGCPDADNDGVADTQDNCVSVPNPGQSDNDNDGQGDVCDPDDDNDGLPDGSDPRPFIPNVAPSCADAVPSISQIWPPNHQLVPVSLLGATDEDGDPLTILVQSIYQDERTNTQGDGNTAIDGYGIGSPTAQVRAERAGSPKAPGDGRVYHITFTVSDVLAASCSATVKVGVPHDQGQRRIPVDNGALHNSTGGQ